MGVGVGEQSFLNRRQIVFQFFKHCVLGARTKPFGRANLMDNLVFVLYIQGPFFHCPAYLPDVFKPQVFNCHNAIIRHTVAEYNILGVKHIWILNNFAGISLEIGNIKSRGSIVIECLYLQQILCVIFRIKIYVRWHLSVCVGGKRNVVLLQPTFKPFLNDVANNIFLSDNNAYIAKKKSDLPLYGFDLILIQQTLIHLLGSHFNRVTHDILN